MFRLYGMSMTGIPVDLYASNGKDGVATFKNVLIGGDIPYTVKEIDTDIKYVIPPDQTGTVK